MANQTELQKQEYMSVVMEGDSYPEELINISQCVQERLDQAWNRDIDSDGVYLCDYNNNTYPRDDEDKGVDARVFNDADVKQMLLRAYELGKQEALKPKEPKSVVKRATQVKALLNNIIAPVHSRSQAELGELEDQLFSWAPNVIKHHGMRRFPQLRILNDFMESLYKKSLTCSMYNLYKFYHASNVSYNDRVLLVSQNPIFNNDFKGPYGGRFPFTVEKTYISDSRIAGVKYKTIVFNIESDNIYVPAQVTMTSGLNMCCHCRASLVGAEAANGYCDSDLTCGFVAGNEYKTRMWYQMRLPCTQRKFHPKCVVTDEEMAALDNPTKNTES